MFDEQAFDGELGWAADKAMHLLDCAGRMCGDQADNSAIDAGAVYLY
jgi:hypothetical protein